MSEQREPTYILAPGRHHLFTEFQWLEFARIIAGEALDADGQPQLDPAVTLIVAITSANHSNTRRNPVPVELRAAQAHLAAASADVAAVTVAVSDVGHTDRFAHHVIGAVGADESVCDANGAPLALHPGNCVVACSTPALAAQFAHLGYRIFPLEHPDDPRTAPEATGPDWSTPRPWQLVEAVAEADGDIGVDAFVAHAHEASKRIWGQHRLGLRLKTLFDDPIVGADSDLTSGRDYFTYMDSFDRGASRKWAMLEPHAREGRVLDIGCATGAVLAEAGETPRFAESDLLGIELSRALYDECLHRRRMGAFGNENTFFYHRNAMEQLFAPRSIDTTMTVSLTHEIVSYIDEAALDSLSEIIFAHTAPNGVWLIYDVCAPLDQDRIVRMRLDDTDGATAAEAAAVDHAALSTDELGRWLDTLTVRARFGVFADTFRAEQEGSPNQLGSVQQNPDGSIDLRLADAMDFLAHHTYTESWRSEMNERFSYRSLEDWQRSLEAIGFEVDDASSTWVNPWLAENRFAPVAQLEDPITAEPVNWGETNLVIVARRP